jgi:hypothetical protein
VFSYRFGKCIQHFSKGVTQGCNKILRVEYFCLLIYTMQNLAMEQQRRPLEKDQMLTLATRKCLFRLLSFLDSQLPDFSAVISY